MDYKSLPSVTLWHLNATVKAPKQEYTGDELLGIATMHKSNSVPVTRGSEMAEATAKMRRG